MTTENAYGPPVDKLLQIGNREGQAEFGWPDYQQEFGIGPANIPELIRLGTDHELHLAEPKDENDEANWGPINAWRALGQLGAVEAVEPLLNTLDWENDDYPSAELPKVFALIGPASLPPLAAYIHNSDHDLFPRVNAMACLPSINSLHPESKEQCVEILVKELENYAANDTTLNAYAVSFLQDLKAESALPAIEAAFKANAVDIEVTDWDAVQFEFGLISQEDYTEREAKNNEIRRGIRAANLLNAPADRPGSESNSRSPSTRTKAQKAKAKTKRKMEKESRRKNRKRK